MLFASLVHLDWRCLNHYFCIIAFTFWSLWLIYVAADQAGISVSICIDITIWVCVVGELFFWRFTIFAAVLGFGEFDFNLRSITIWTWVCALRFDNVLRVFLIHILFLLSIFRFRSTFLILLLGRLGADLILHYKLRFNQRYKRIVFNQTWQAFVWQSHHILTIRTFDFLGLRISEHKSQALCTKAVTAIEHKWYACLRIPIIKADWAFHLI